MDKEEKTGDLESNLLDVGLNWVSRNGEREVRRDMLDVKEVAINWF